MMGSVNRSEKRGNAYLVNRPGRRASPTTIVIGEGTTVLKLLAGEYEVLLVGRDAFLVLDLGFDVVDSVRGLNLKVNGLARQGLGPPSQQDDDSTEQRMTIQCNFKEGESDQHPNNGRETAFG